VRTGLAKSGKEAKRLIADGGARLDDQPLTDAGLVLDTAALARAHVSVSPASALDIARVASDIVVTGQTLLPVAEALRTARATRRRIKENFALAAGYNAVAIPLAVLGHATPLLAALAMSASSITVTLNSWRLR